MILVIGSDKEVKEVIEESKFSELGVWERKHVENWILDYPEILGEDLLIITSEYDRFNKTRNRLDILAIDKNGKLVVIELKRDVAEKYVDLQAIHYAAFCSTLNLEQVIDLMLEYNEKTDKKISRDDIDSKISDFIINSEFSDFDNQPRIMLVANDFREETLSAVLWLRDNGIDITCIKLDPYKIDNKIVIKSEVLVPLPEAINYIIQAEQKRKTSQEFTRRQKQYYEFWAKVLEEFKKKLPDVTSRRATKDSWMGLGIGYGNTHLEWYFRRRPEESFCVSIHFEYPNYEDNRRVIDYFYNKRDILQKEFPEDELIFQKKWGRKWAQIFLKREDGDFNAENISWGVDRMVKFHEVFKPELKKYFAKK